MNEITPYRSTTNAPVPRTGAYVSHDLQAYSSLPVNGRSPLPEYWEALRRHKFIILAVALCGLFAGGLFTYLQTPMYRARTTLELQGVNENLLNMKSFDPNAAAEYSTEAYIQTQIQILKSDSLLERAANKLNYPERPEFSAPANPSGWRKMLGLRQKATPTVRERMLASLRSRLRVEAAGLTRILELTFDSPDPEQAAEFLNAWAQEYIGQNLEARGSGSQATNKWLTQQLADFKAKLEASDNQLQAYARKTGLIFTNEKDNLVEEKLRQVQNGLSQAEAERIIKQSQYEMAKSSPPESLPEVLNDGSLRDYQAKLTELNRQLAEFSATLTPEHYKIQRLQAQITEVKSALNQQRGNIVNRIRNEFEAAQRRESLLRAEYNKEHGVLTGQAGETTRYNVLKREVDANRQMYDALLQRMKESNIASAMRTSGIRVLDPAVAPSQPYKPNGPLNLMIGLFSALLLAIGMAVVLARNDATLHLPGEVSNSLSVPELGLIPAGKGKNLELVTWEQKVSPMAESFRSTVASMMFADENDGKASRVIVFTSASPGEGKSTVITNVAIAWAQTRNQRVLLIDADTRRPVLHKFLGLPNTVGIMDLLIGTEPITDAAIVPAIQETFVPNLSLMARGAGISDLVTPLYSPRLQQLLAVCREKYDVVLIDTPPMLQMPDARIMGRLADRVILVVRSGKTARGAAVFAAQKFAEDGTPIFGGILNSFDIGNSAYPYRGY
jgi:succinoglycan biosynthesis transport protein ExoP